MWGFPVYQKGHELLWLQERERKAIPWPKGFGGGSVGASPTTRGRQHAPWPDSSAGIIYLWKWFLLCPMRGDARWFTTVHPKLKAISEKTKESKTRRELQLEKKCYHTSWQHQDHPACQQNWVLPTTSPLSNHILQSNASQMFPNEKCFF